MEGLDFACLYSSSLSVLVNGFQTEEINIQKGLEKGYLIPFFLFLLVVDGLGASLKKKVSIGVFDGFKLGTGELEEYDL